MTRHPLVDDLDAQPDDRLWLARFMAALNASQRMLELNRALGEAVADRHIAYLGDLDTQQDSFTLIALGQCAPLGLLLVIAREASDNFATSKARRNGYLTHHFILESLRQQRVEVVFSPRFLSRLCHRPW